MESQIRQEVEAELMEGASNEVVEKLRLQLVQVEEERQRWQSEQEEIQRKVMNSQVQFEKVREGFKSKYRKQGKLCFMPF